MNTKEALDYAWRWFEYHAGQRLVAFRFFLIILGVLVVGLTNSFKDGNVPSASVISGAGAFISFAFLMLEIRNEQLVNVGRDALSSLEESEDFKNLPSQLKLFHIDRKRPLLLSHKLWLRLIYAACIAAFIVLFLFLCWNPTIVLGPSSGKGP